MRFYLKKGGEKMLDNQEKLLQERIKQMDTLPESVNQKIEITLQQLTRKGENAMKKRRKLVPIAAAILIILFLGGNGIAYAMGKPNLFSFVLSKFSISEQYEEIAKEIGITQESNGVEITVTDLGIDNNMLIVGYRIKGNAVTKTPFFLEGEKTIKEKAGKEIDINYHSTGERRNKQQIEQITTGEYQLYEIYPLSTAENEMELTISLTKLQFYTSNEYGVEYGEEISGRWNFSIPILRESEASTIEYQPKNASFTLSSTEKIEFNRISVNQIATMIDLTAHTDTLLTMQIKNRSGDVLLTKDAQEIMNGQNHIVMKRIQDDSDLFVEFYVYGTDKKRKEGTLVLTGNEIVKPNDVSEQQVETLGSMKLTFPKKWEVNKEQENTLLLMIYQEYQNKQKVFDSYVKVEQIENNENLSLAEIKKKEIISEEIAYDVRENNYFVYDTLQKKYAIIDEKDYPNEKGNKFMITKQEISEILQGKVESVLKGSLRVTKQELEDILQPGFKVQEEEKLTLSGKEAYGLNIRTDGGTQEVILIKEGKRYYKITYSLVSKEKKQIEQMIKNIVFV